AALIPSSYQVGVGLDSLFIVHGFGLFGGFFTISLSGSVTIDASRSFGGGTPVQTHPTGVTVDLDAPGGSPVEGETWTLTLDGLSYSTRVTSGESLAGVASALAALIPISPAATQGGPYYTVSVDVSTLSIRRIDQPLPVTASVS